METASMHDIRDGIWDAGKHIFSYRNNNKKLKEQKNNRQRTKCIGLSKLYDEGNMVCATCFINCHMWHAKSKLWKSNFRRIWKLTV